MCACIYVSTFVTEPFGIPYTTETPKSHKKAHFFLDLTNKTTYWFSLLAVQIAQCALSIVSKDAALSCQRIKYKYNATAVKFDYLLGREIICYGMHNVWGCFGRCDSFEVKSSQLIPTLEWTGADEFGPNLNKV